MKNWRGLFLSQSRSVVSAKRITLRHSNESHSIAFTVGIIFSVVITFSGDTVVDGHVKEINY